MGHLSQDFFSLTVLLTLSSITLTSYYIQYSDSFYKFLKKPLRIFDFFTTEGLEYLPTQVKPTIILCGHNRIGYSILRGLQRNKKNVLVIDYNPEIISRMIKEGYHCIYGEIGDEEIVERMNLPKITMLISTIPNLKDNIFLIRHVRKVNKHAKVFVTANDIDEAIAMYEEGADYVILPNFLGGEHVSHPLEDIQKKKIKMHEERKRHLRHLQERKKIGHTHPKGVNI